MRFSVVLLACAACGVRAPAPIELGPLVARRGPVEAHRDLVIRVLADPKDIAARLALAELDERDRPSEAIDQLVVVEQLGGPIGVRWHDADRARLGRLLAMRGAARLARGAASALADLERARQLGAVIAPGELLAARAAVAIGELRHVDAAERAKGRAALAELAGGALADPSWAGARAKATPAEHGAFGAWLWTVGARREAYEQLAAWHAGARPPRELALQSAYLRALAWWTPYDAPPPPRDELVGPERCRFTDADCTMPPPAEVAPPPVALGPDPRAQAAARYAHAHVAGAPAEAALAAIAAAYRRDPAVAERFARELVDASPDAAAAHAALGALYDALGDPGRARASWQAAVDASDEPAFERGLALAAARGGDGPASAVFATAAAAAWGDPAAVWLDLARELERGGRHVDALAAARSAIELADADTLPPALDVAIAASQALGRGQAVTLAAIRRRFPPPPGDATEALAAIRALPTTVTIARAWVVSRDHPRDVALRGALVHALDADDPRRAAASAELVGLAGDPDGDLALGAVFGLR